jgi:hypothetical protein
MNCDALLMLRTDLPYQQFYPKDARMLVDASLTCLWSGI